MTDELAMLFQGRAEVSSSSTNLLSLLMLLSSPVSQLSTMASYFGMTPILRWVVALDLLMLDRGLEKGKGGLCEETQMFPEINQIQVSYLRLQKSCVQVPYQTNQVSKGIKAIYYRNPNPASQPATNINIE